MCQSKENYEVLPEDGGKVFIEKVGKVEYSLERLVDRLIDCNIG